MNRMDEALWAVWESGQFVGNNRPVTRASISKRTVQLWGATPYRSLLFSDLVDGGDFGYSVEIPNIKQVTINRRLGQDAATMTMTVLNQTAPSAATNLDETHGAASGPTRRELVDLGSPGAYTFGRGTNVLGAEDISAERWGHVADGTWVDMFIPNRLITTFQGYGTSGAGRPVDDTKLVRTGIWLIDNVNFSSQGVITISCRDAAKLLIEQRLYPPIIPQEKYPLEICADHTITKTVAVTPDPVDTDTVVDSGTTTTTSPDLGYHVSSGWDSSVAPWKGHNGSYYGHRASDAFDGDETTYWLSIGNNPPTASFAYEWLEADVRGEPCNRVRFKPKWGGYLVYVSVKEDGVWQGTSTIPYDPGSIGRNGADIPYVMVRQTSLGEAWVGFTLPRIYRADRVRLTFYKLYDTGSQFGPPVYRAGIYEMQVRLRTTSEPPPPPDPGVDPDPTLEDVTEFVSGNLAQNDYTDIIKLLCAWSGFFWPYGGSPDPMLAEWADGADIGNGRVWGDFMYSGAMPVEPPCIPPSFWDNKSVMDGINQIKEILGFIFYVDSSGGVVWRPPNIWVAGNYIQGTGYVGPDSIRDIDETQVLLDYGVTINDENLRSEIIVVSSEDPSLYGSFTPGHAGAGSPSAVSDLALLGGQERIMLVPNYPFVSEAEVAKFAYLVSLWTHWSYRKSKFRIPGNPALEPDDQVRIYERVTSESFVHYLLGVSSTMDLDAGTYFMDVDTHWLGNGPGDAWVVNFSEMTPALYAYLKAIGQISDDLGEGDIPPGYLDPDADPDLVIEPPRVDDDYAPLYPDLPTVTFPPGSWSTEDPFDNDDPWITEPDPVSGIPGSAWACYNAAKTAYWGPHGQAGAQQRVYLMTAWNSSLPAADQEQSHSSQSRTVYANLDGRTRFAWYALGMLFADEFYIMNGASGYNNRLISGSSNWSNHAWGHACDIDSGTWPRPQSGTTPATGSDTDYLNWLAARGISTTQWSKLKAVGQKSPSTSFISTGNNQRIFRWGGEWTNRDPMHFEICCTPDDLRTGVKYKGTLLFGSVWS